MKSIALDTNVLIDYFLERPNYPRIVVLLESAYNSEILLYLPLPVVLECEWILKSYYNLAKLTIVQWMKKAFSFQGFVIDNKDAVLEAIDLYAQSSGVSFDDCLIVRMVEKAKVSELVTSDRALQKLWQKL